jgi:type I restriction enzyme, S subunit
MTQVTLGWCKAQLGDVTELRNIKIEPAETPKANYVSLEHIESNTSRLVAAGSASDVKSAKSQFRRGDVLYGKLRPYLNKVTVAPFDGICSTDILVFAETEAISNRYLARLLSTRSTVDFATQHSQGINLPRVSALALSQLPVLVPPRNEQERIGAKLDELLQCTGSARSALESVQPLIRRFRQAVLAAAFRGDLTADWREKNPGVEPASVLLDRIRKERRQKWEEAELAKRQAKGKTPSDYCWKEKHIEPRSVFVQDLPVLPERWRWASVEQIAFVESGQTPPGVDGLSEDNGVVPWFRVSDMNSAGNEETLFNAAVRLSTESVVKLGLHVRPAGTMIFPKRGGAIATNKKRRLAQPSAYDLNLMGLVPVGSISDYLWWWLQNIDLGEIATGSAVPQINHGDIAPLFVPLPPLLELDAISEMLKNAFAQLADAAVSVDGAFETVDRLEDAILTKAFRGELVPQDPSDEPASILLERIRSQGKPESFRDRRRAACDLSPA